MFWSELLTIHSSAGQSKPCHCSSCWLFNLATCIHTLSVFASLGVLSHQYWRTHEGKCGEVQQEGNEWHDENRQWVVRWIQATGRYMLICGRLCNRWGWTIQSNTITIDQNISIAMLSQYGSQTLPISIYTLLSIKQNLHNYEKVWPSFQSSEWLFCLSAYSHNNKFRARSQELIWIIRMVVPYHSTRNQYNMNTVTIVTQH